MLFFEKIIYRLSGHINSFQIPVLPFIDSPQLSKKICLHLVTLIWMEDFQTDVTNLSSQQGVTARQADDCADRFETMRKAVSFYLLFIINYYYLLLFIIIFIIYLLKSASNETVVERGDGNKYVS